MAAASPAPAALRSRSAAAVAAPTPFTHTFSLHVTEAALKAAEVGVETIKSPSFDGYSGKWFISVCLAGSSEEDCSEIGVFLQAPSELKGRLEISACGKSLSNLTAAEPATIPKPPVGWGYPKLVSHREAVSWLASHDGIMEITATFQPAAGVTTRVLSGADVMNIADTPILPPSMPEQMRALLSSGEGADVTLLCDGEIVPVHSYVLSLRSPVLRVLLARRMRELAAASDPARAPAAMVLPVAAEIEPPVLRKLLEHLYTDEEVDFDDANEAQHLFNAADMYGLLRLRSLCERFLARSLTVENAAFTLVLADQHSAVGLRSRAVDFICSNAAAVVETEGWEHLQKASNGLAHEVLVATVKRTAAGGGGGSALAAASGVVGKSFKI